MEEKNIFAELAKAKDEENEQEINEELKEIKNNEKDLEGQLIVDVYQNDDEIVIQSLIAGVNPEDLEININNEAVTIKGERKKIEKVDEKNYFFQECFWGKFSRTIILPQEIDAEKAKASFKNGILTIRLPKLYRHKNKSIKIKID